MARRSSFLATVMLVCCLADISSAVADETVQWYPKVPPTVPSKRSPPPPKSRLPPSPRRSPSPPPKRASPPPPKRSPPPRKSPSPPPPLRSPPPPKRSPPPPKRSPPPSPKKSPPPPKRSPPPPPKRSPPPPPKRSPPPPPKRSPPPPPKRASPPPKPVRSPPPRPRASPLVPFARPPPRRPSPSPVSPGFDPKAEILLLPSLVGELISRLQAGGAQAQLPQILPLLARISPHAAAYLSRTTTTRGTFMLPSVLAVEDAIASLGNLDRLSYYAQLSAYRTVLTVIAYHFIPGRAYSSAELFKLVEASGRYGYVVSTLVPNAKLHVLISRESLWLMDGFGDSSQLFETDLSAGSRLTFHIIDQVLTPPTGSEMPLTGAYQQVGTYSTLYDWLADPSNLDAVTWRVLTGFLPASFWIPLKNSRLQATLFVPANYTLLDSPAVREALSSPPARAAVILGAVLRAHIILDGALSETNIAAIYFGGVEVSGQDTCLIFTHGDPPRPTDPSVQVKGIPIVNNVRIRYLDFTAGKSYVHVLSTALDIDVEQVLWQANPSPNLLNLKADLMSLADTAEELLTLLKSSSVTLERVLPVLYRLSPHAAAYLFHNSSTKATFFLPSAKAIQTAVCYLGSRPGIIDYLGQAELLPLYREAITTVAYHLVPGQAWREAELKKAAAAAGRDGLELDTLVDATLTAEVDSGDLIIGDYDGAYAYIEEADLAVGSRFVVHYVDTVLLPPIDAEVPLTGPNPQDGIFPTLYSWLSYPFNLDATVFHLMSVMLPDEFFADLKKPGFKSTLFAPYSDSLLASPAVLQAVGSPPEIATQMLAAILRAHLLPEEVLDRDDIFALPDGTRLNSAVNTPLVFDQITLPTKPNPTRAVTVNGVRITYYDFTGGQSYVHILARPLNVTFA